jgi:hypothetical protein
MLDEKGSPSVTERAWIAPPASQIGPIPDAARDAIRKDGAALYGQYDEAVDRESAYEKLKARTTARSGESRASGGLVGSGPEAAPGGAGGLLSDILFGTTGPRGGKHDGLVQSAAKSAARSVGSGLGRAILRGALGSILGGTTRRRR